MKKILEVIRLERVLFTVSPYEMIKVIISEGSGTPISDEAQKLLTNNYDYIRESLPFSETEKAGLSDSDAFELACNEVFNI